MLRSVRRQGTGDYLAQKLGDLGEVIEVGRVRLPAVREAGVPAARTAEEVGDGRARLGADAAPFRADVERPSHAPGRAIAADEEERGPGPGPARIGGARTIAAIPRRPIRRPDHGSGHDPTDRRSTLDQQPRRGDRARATGAAGDTKGVAPSRWGGVRLNTVSAITWRADGYASEVSAREIRLSAAVVRLHGTSTAAQPDLNQGPSECHRTGQRGWGVPPVRSARNRGSTQ
jgi:hypothetical protein